MRIEALSALDDALKGILDTIINETSRRTGMSANHNSPKVTK